jgi:hypothetical protein
MEIFNTESNYIVEKNCFYKDEHYSVRDNGTIYRHSREGKKIRSLDCQWTLGKFNLKTGYMEISGERVHRIVAIAFHGLPPTKEHVVDHIDTNKRNNRPENLRWVTRLENVLLNPITAKKIAYICGSVEEFLINPQNFREKFTEPNYSWMREVSEEEGKNSLKRMLEWSKTANKSNGSSLDEWIYKRNIPEKRIKIEKEKLPELNESTPKNVIQRSWKIPSDFPLCPQSEVNVSLLNYVQNLKVGDVFCRNDIYTSLVEKFEISEDETSISVLTKSEKGAIKNWALAQITLEDEKFIHTSLGNFFTKEGAEKQYCISLGKEWLGGDSIDDYC